MHHGDYGEMGCQQGTYGDNQQKKTEITWSCPECETINTGTACTVCNYVKKQRNYWKIIAAGLTAVLILITGLFLLPNSWKEADGNLYYYHYGRKTIGEAEIDGEQYFFDEKGVMHTGWRETPDEMFFYNSDGRMVTGFQKINGHDYYFHSDGTMKMGWLELNGNQYYLDTDGRMLIGTHTIGTDKYSFDDQGRLIKREYELSDIPSSATSEEDTYYVRNDKRKGTGKYQILDRPIENCSEITVTVTVSNLKSGNVDNWGFYIRDLAGRWKRCGDIVLKNNTGSTRFAFDAPMESFDAYVCFCESLGTYWDFSFTQELSDVVVVEFY